MGSSNKKTLYSTRSCVNWPFFGTRGPLKRSFHSCFKLAHTCQKKANLHTNSFNKLTCLQINLYLEQPMEVQLFATFLQRRK
jgi:hypothetical protein